MRYCMLQYSSEVRVVFVTTHVGYTEVRAADQGRDPRHH